MASKELLKAKLEIALKALRKLSVPLSKGWHADIASKALQDIEKVKCSES